MTQTTKSQVIGCPFQPAQNLVRLTAPRARNRTATLIELALAYAFVCAIWGILICIALQVALG